MKSTPPFGRLLAPSWGLSQQRWLFLPFCIRCERIEKRCKWFTTARLTKCTLNETQLKKTRFPIIEAEPKNHLEWIKVDEKRAKFKEELFKFIDKGEFEVA